MHDRMIPSIPKGSKVIVGLGDSFTQGVGSWPKSVWDQYNGYIDTLKIPQEIYDQMYEYSWVKQLCDNHLTDYIPVNLGCLGTGNRAAVKELYLNPAIELDNASEVIVVLMLSGIERFDFVNNCFPEHNHFYTMWPNPQDKNTTNKKLWEAYAETLWSEKFTIVEAIMNIREAEMFCKSKGYKFIVASAFDTRINRDYFITHMSNNIDLIDTVPWDNFLYPAGKSSFMELLMCLEGQSDIAKFGFYQYCHKLKGPTNYVSPCAHPSQNGYTVMAQHIHKFLVSKKFV